MGRSGRRSTYGQAWETPLTNQTESGRSTVAAAKILTGPATPIPTRDLAPVELARVESLRWVCDIRMGQAPDTPGGPAPPQSAVVPPPMGAGRAVAAGSRKFKLSAILDPTLEAEEPRSWTRIIVQSSGTFQRDSDISPDQMAAVAQVIKTGAVSFADFISLFVPRPASPKVPDLHRLQPVDRYGGMAEERATGPHGLKHTWYQCYIRCSAPACCCSMLKGLMPAADTFAHHPG